MQRRKYRHISKVERQEIALYMEKGYSLRDISRMVCRSPSTICEEIKRNSVNGAYDPLKANHKAYCQRKYSKYQGMKVEENKMAREYVETRIRREWSPKQVSGRMKIDIGINVGKNGIYKYVGSVYGRSLEQYLRYKGKRRRGKRIPLMKLKDRTFIDERPILIDDRLRYGDWEGDLIVSGKQGKGVLLVLYERKSQYAMIRKVMSLKTNVINMAFGEQIKKVCCNSLTLDNDISFAKHIELSLMLNASIYFCHPYHSWEKGGVENVNKLIRQYVPKGSDISTFNDEYIHDVEERLNNRPREGLGYKTPLEVMMENNQFKIPLNMISLNKKTLVKCSD